MPDTQQYGTSLQHIHMDIEISYYTLKMSDGKIHFFKKTIIKPSMKVEELEHLAMSDVELAEKIVNSLNGIKEK